MATTPKIIRFTLSDGETRTAQVRLGTKTPMERIASDANSQTGIEIIGTMKRVVRDHRVSLRVSCVPMVKTVNQHPPPPTPPPPPPPTTLSVEVLNWERNPSSDSSSRVWSSLCSGFHRRIKRKPRKSAGKFFEHTRVFLVKRNTA